MVVCLLEKLIKYLLVDLKNDYRKYSIDVSLISEHGVWLGGKLGCQKDSFISFFMALVKYLHLQLWCEQCVSKKRSIKPKQNLVYI